MPKRWSSKEVDQILCKNGFSFVGQKGSHRKYVLNGKTVMVPSGRNPLPQGTFASIVRQSGLDISKFR